jgi:4-hydroxy-tetrahydrodipicolinate reductase
VLGAGRMGRSLVAAIQASDAFDLVGVWVRSAGRNNTLTIPSSAGAIANCNLAELIDVADVAIDFTLPEATAQILDDATSSGTPLVCGVSGLDAGQMRQLRDAAQVIPLLYDRNMSPGAAVLTELVRFAAKALGQEYLASIEETHHVHKKDAPSGTALQLGAALAEARNLEFPAHYRYEPNGTATRRSPEDIVFTAERRGEVAGDHSVHLGSDAERLELRHSVGDRRVFAEGALRAARWLARRPPGLYTMRDVVHAGDTLPV